MQKRTVVAATIAAAVGAIPIPGVDVYINISFSLNECVFMTKVLGVINFIGDTSKLECARVCATYLSEVGLQSLLKLCVSMLAGDVLKFIPIVGSIVSSMTSFATAKSVLQKILDNVVEVARKRMETEEQEQ